MNRVTLAAVALLLLAAPAAEAAATGARSPVSADGNAVNDVAIAPSTSDQCSAAATAQASAPCRFLAGTQDPGSTLSFSADEPTWHLWRLDGSLLTQKGADPVGTPDNCPQPQDPTQRCQTDVRRVAISADGARIAVGSTARSGGQSYLFTFLSSGAMQASKEMGMATWNGLSMDGTGQLVAVALAVNTGDPTDGQDGLLGGYDFTTFAKRFEIAPEAPAVAVDVSPTGNLVAAGAGSHFRFNALGTPFEDPNIQGDAVAVDASGHANTWSVAGYDSGFFALYAGSDQPSVAKYQKREATDPSAIQSVAIRDGATAFATGNSGGRIRLYSLDPATTSDPPVAMTAERSGLGSVTALAFSSDGRYLAAITASSVRLYYTGNGQLDEMWTDARTGLVATALAIDGRGEHVVAGVGNTVIVYDAVHKLTATSLPSASQSPGTTANYTLQVRNDGNRAESVAFSHAAPAGINVTFDPPTATLLPTASATVKVTVEIPAGRPAGALNIPVRQALNGGSDGTPSVTMALTIPTVHRIPLTAIGADSKGARGGPASFDVLARNEGNVAETLQFRVDGLPAGWTYHVAPANVTLPAGTETTLAVSIQPPTNVPDGTTVVATLRGGLATPLQLTTTVGAVFGVRVTVPVGLLVEEGVTANLTATVRNDGNAPDSFVLKLGTLPAGWLGGFLDGQSEQQVDGLAPGETRNVDLSLRAPSGAGASGVPLQVTVVGTSLGDPTKSSSGRVLVTVNSSSATSTTGDGGDGDGFLGIPGPAPALLLALLALGAVAVRRRR
jgi:WD40 repeat protein